MSALVPHATALFVVATLFAATLIRSTFGFGEALFAVPVLALRIPVDVAAPLAVLVSITVAALVVIQDWNQIHVRSAGSLLGATLFGLPLGLWLLTGAHPAAVKLVLASVILAFAAYALRVRNPPELRSESRLWLVGCGFLAGILGGAYGMNGPPLVIYGAMRRWPAQRFRATLQGYFLPASLLGMVGYALAGLWTSAVTRYFLLSLPAIVLATLLGRIANRRMRAEAFLKYVYVGLAAVGLALAAQSVAALAT